METVIIVNGNYKNSSCLKNEIHYVTNYEKTHGYFGGRGINPYEPVRMVEQMRLIKKVYDRATGYRQLRHIVISFEQNWNVTADKAFVIANEISKYYSERFQVCYGVHLDTDNIHIHFIQNTVSYVDGKMFSGGSMELDFFKRYVRDVIEKYIPESMTKCTMEEFLRDN